MRYREYQNARDAAWRLLIDCNVRELPVKVGTICKKLDIRVWSYEKGKNLINHFDLTNQILQTDGFLIFLKERPCIFYNNFCTRQRQRFTIAHEIGHLLLGHINPGQITAINREVSPSDNPIEKAANQFAIRLLAPACVLWGKDIHTAEEISKLCDISKTAASFREQRMEKLYKRNKFLISSLERQLFKQFKN